MENVARPLCINRAKEPNSDSAMPSMKQMQNALMRVDQLSVDASLIYGKIPSDSSGVASFPLKTLFSLSISFLSAINDANLHYNNIGSQVDLVKECVIPKSVL